jgi:hypothetical protein
VVHRAIRKIAFQVKNVQSKGPDCGQHVQPGERMTDAGPVLQYYFADAKRLPLPQPDFGKNVLAVEFSTKLRWMISELP